MPLGSHLWFLLDNAPGIDRQRKAHWVIEGLGRWETPRNIRIFGAIGGKSGQGEAKCLGYLKTRHDPTNRCPRCIGCNNDFESLS